MSSAEAAQRSTIVPSRQRQTRRVRNRTPLCGLSITFVETRQRERAGDKPRRLTVNRSVKPSRKLAAALRIYVTDRERVFAVRNGDEVAKRYRVVRIEPAGLKFQDEVLKRTAELAFPK